MRTIATWPLSAVLVVGGFLLPGRGQAAFPTCQDAMNYGINTSRLYVGQAFATIHCDATRLDAANGALAKLLAKFIFASSDSDAEKLCLFRGVWTGLVAAVADQYKACGTEPPFACVDEDELAVFAGATLHAISRSLADPASFDAAAVPQVFETESSATGAPLCSPQETLEWCELTIRSKAGFSALRYSELADDIALIVCAGG